MSLFMNRHTAPGLVISVIVLVACFLSGHLAWADQAGQAPPMHEKENRTTQYEDTLLLTAALSKSHDEVERLIDQGISVAVTDSVGWTPLHYALSISSDDTPPDATRKTALTLIERGAPVDAETTVAGWRPLHLAVWQRDPSIVRALIEHGADVNAQMRLGEVTPLHLALHQLNVIPVEARQRDWSQARLEEQLKAAEEVVTVLRAAGAIDRLDEDAFPRYRFHIGFLHKKRIVMYPDPRIANMSVFTSGYSIKGSFTAKAAEEHLISEPIGYVGGLTDFGSITGILGKDGRVRIQWVSDRYADEPELCFDAVSGLNHVGIRLHSSFGGTAYNPYSIYMHYDAVSSMLVEGFSGFMFGRRTAEPGEDGACNWRQAKHAVEVYKRVYSALRADEAVTTKYPSLFTMPTRTVERATAASSLAALRALPSDVAVVRSFDSLRWEVVVVKPFGSTDVHRYFSEKMGILLVRDKGQDSWRSILGCRFTDVREVLDNTLLFDANKACEEFSHFSVRVRLDLISMQAIVVWPDDCESIDDCHVEVPYDAGELDCVQVDEGNIPAMDGNTLAGEMVLIPGGTFRMGDLSGEGRIGEKPVHSVTVPAFRLGKYEVTFAQWDACVADGGCNGYSPDAEGWRRCNRPVTGVSWIDTQFFITWLNARTGGKYRLPSEAEWEYAARAGSTTKYSWGDDIGENRANCNNKECGDHWYYTAPVGSFAANAWGLHDMHGNAEEWVQDCWHANYKEAPDDGSAWTTGVDCNMRVLRGGSFRSELLRPSSYYLRSAIREIDFRSGRYVSFGFRIAHNNN